MAFYGNVSIQFLYWKYHSTYSDSEWLYMTGMMTLYYDGYAENTFAKNVLPTKKTGFFAQCLNQISNSSVNISEFETQSPFIIRSGNLLISSEKPKITLAAGYRYRTYQHWTLNKLRSMQTQSLSIELWYGKLDCSVQCSHKINMKKFFHFFFVLFLL